MQGLAPDEASLKAAKGLTHPGKWTHTGYTERAVWGECQGSGDKPYQTRIDLNGPAFKCSCPSRKFPCKHSLALLLLYADRPKLFTQGSLPGWVDDWINGRDAQAQKKAKEPKTAEAPPDPEAQAKRIAQRQEKIVNGIDELSVWLCDLLRQGLAWAHSQPTSYWNNMAARLVDAQAAGLANRVKKMGETALSGQNWQDRLLLQAAKLFLLVEAYRRLDHLDENLKQDVRSQVGWTVSKEQLLEQEAVRDRWFVLSQQIEQQESLEVQRTWLWGQRTGRYALILDFAAANAVLDKSLLTGTVIEAGLVFYPGVDPHRALIKERKEGGLRQIEKVDVNVSVSQLLALYADRLQKMPWTEAVPSFLGPLRIVPENSGDGAVTGWQGIDSDGRTIMLSPRFHQGWHAFSLSGGKPVTFFGEWNGGTFLPFSLFFEDAFYMFVELPVYAIVSAG